MMNGWIHIPNSMKTYQLVFQNPDLDLNQNLIDPFLISMPHTKFHSNPSTTVTVRLVTHKIRQAILFLAQQFRRFIIFKISPSSVSMSTHNLFYLLYSHPDLNSDTEQNKWRICFKVLFTMADYVKT